MSHSVNTFFSLLRSGMYGLPLPESELPRNIDWETVIKLAQKHAVYGIIIDSVRFLPERLRPTGTVAAKMNRFALGLIQTNLILDKTVGRLVTFFKQYGINGVLLKGQGIARLYRMPQMRQSGDIDFYVGKKFYKKALDLCREKLIGDKDECNECEKHFSFTMDGVPIELHRLATRIYSPFRKNRFQKWIVEELEHSPNRRILTIGNTDVALPSYDFDAIFIFYHAWRHYITGGIGLRQLCDWAMIFHTHGGDIDWKRLKDNIARFGMTEGWKLFACIAVDHLGLSEDQMPLYDPSYLKKSEKILEEILDGGNFGYYTKESIRIRGHEYGFLYGLAKVPAITKYFISLFPLIPVEATFLFFNRLFNGAISCTKKSLHKLSN